MRRRWVVLGAVIVAILFFAAGYAANSAIGGGVDAARCEAAVSYFKVREGQIGNLGPNTTADLANDILRKYNAADQSMIDACLP
jgi:hypothetical protein